MSQPQISTIRRMKTDDFSLVRLQEVLRYLGVDVEIALHKRDDGGIGTSRLLQRQPSQKDGAKRSLALPSDIVQNVERMAAFLARLGHD